MSRESTKIEDFSRYSNVSNLYYDLSTHNYQDFLFLQPKTEGIQHGGFYLNRNNDLSYILKSGWYSVIREFITAPLFKRWLYNRTATISIAINNHNISPIINSDVDRWRNSAELNNKATMITSKLLPNASNLRDLELRNIKKKLDDVGFEKLLIASLAAADLDPNDRNIVVPFTGKDKGFVHKIDGGSAGILFFENEKQLRKALSVLIKNHEYGEHFIINLQRTIDAVFQIIQISDTEIENFISRQMAILTKYNITIKDHSPALDLSKLDSILAHYSKEAMGIAFENNDEAKEWYITKFKKQLSVMRDFHEILRAIILIDNQVNELLHNKWLELCQVEDVIIEIARYNHTIEKLHPFEWAVRNNVKIKDQQPLHWIFKQKDFQFIRNNKYILDELLKLKCNVKGSAVHAITGFIICYSAEQTADILLHVKNYDYLNQIDTEPLTSQGKIDFLYFVFRKAAMINNFNLLDYIEKPDYKYLLKALTSRPSLIPISTVEFLILQIPHDQSLIIAVENGNTNLIGMVLKLDCDANAIMPALELAVSRSQTRIIQKILEHKNVVWPNKDLVICGMYDASLANKDQKMIEFLEKTYQEIIRVKASIQNEEKTKEANNIPPPSLVQKATTANKNKCIIQ